MSKNEKTPFKIPISVIELTSHLQSKVFKDYPETAILPHVQRVDVNRDGVITVEDIKAFTVKCDSKITPQMDETSINSLFTRLR